MGSPNTWPHLTPSKDVQDMWKEDKPKQANSESRPANSAISIGTNNRQVGNGIVCEGYINT